MRPWTKHFNIKYHHFRGEERKGTLSIYHIKTEEQLVDIFAKPLSETPFMRLREKIMRRSSQATYEQNTYYIEMRECE
jgi:hypothetical protein